MRNQNIHKALSLSLWLVISVLCSNTLYSQASIAVISDIHYYSDKLHDNGSLFKEMIYKGDGKNLFIQNELFSAFIDNLKKDRPSALLITGDLSFNGEKLSHRDLASRLRRIESLGIDVFVLPGNHDILSPGARKVYRDKAYKAESVSSDKFKSIYKNFGYKNALSYDVASLSYLIEPVPGIQILMLDTNRYEDNYFMGYSDPGGSLDESSRRWIKDQAAAAARDNKELIVAMHHSLIEHNIMVSQGYTIQDNGSLISLFSSLGIDTVLTGHIHIQDIIGENTEDGMIYDIATSAFSVFPHNYGLLEFYEKHWVYRTKAVDVSRWAVKNNISESHLLDFDRYASDFFVGFSHAMARKSLLETGFQNSEISRISELAGILNLNFFAGREENNIKDFDGRDLDSLFRENKSFFSQYLESIVSDSAPSDNYLLINKPF